MTKRIDRGPFELARPYTGDAPKETRKRDKANKYETEDTNSVRA